jgi:murein DD-endopeptidase MepM/ murein hydrolase activator NlpD
VQEQPLAEVPHEVVQDAPAFRWPVTGRILSAFGGTAGGERNDGINIAATQGEPVRASAAGTVTYCGNELKGYGNLVLIRHDSGYVTAYAHADSIMVGRGDRVAAGQVIATAGSTGDVNVPQLHFEIRRGVRPVDPVSLLPRSLVLASN